jgi:DNA-binding Lrp family transcriptional regulator
MISEHSSFIIQHLTFDRSTAWEQNLRALTAQAGLAAELGQWDQVEECYRLRGEHLRDHPISPALATDLTQFDREVEARIAHACSAVQSQLIETAKIRQNLQGLRSWQGLNDTEHPLMDQQA